MKKFTMTKTQYRALLPAIRKLIRYYEGKRELGIRSCPLCKVSLKLHFASILKSQGVSAFDASAYDGDKCRFCPWKLFTRMHCETYVKKYYGPTVASHLRAYREPRWTRNRIRTLKRQEARIKGIIEGGIS